MSFLSRFGKKHLSRKSRRPRLQNVESLEARRVLTSLIGDSDGNGMFDSSDLVEAFSAGLYETGEAATFQQGDWNDDGVFNSSDMVAVFEAGHYNIPVIIAADPGDIDDTDEGQQDEEDGRHRGKQTLGSILNSFVERLEEVVAKVNAGEGEIEGNLSVDQLQGLIDAAKQAIADGDLESAKDVFEQVRGNHHRHDGERDNDRGDGNEPDRDRPDREDDRERPSAADRVQSMIDRIKAMVERARENDRDLPGDLTFDDIEKTLQDATDALNDGEVERAGELLKDIFAGDRERPERPNGRGDNPPVDVEAPTAAERMQAVIDQLLERVQAAKDRGIEALGGTPIDEVADALEQASVAVAAGEIDQAKEIVQGLFNRGGNRRPGDREPGDRDGRNRPDDRDQEGEEEVDGEDPAPNVQEDNGRGRPNRGQPVRPGGR